ncbi:MAG: hypothetical protein H6822_17480 [Planctomycetaceae bacterium]|nr:hypothetical protein [Planctomycetales bacterium]MCB9923978.1 hypothetical protein [Planctomycetaceae bacterium]
MQPNFFQWIRDGVKQSVLLGVSDAVDQLGTIPHSEKLNDQLRATLAFDDEPRTTTARVAQSGARKRLGRSLKDA